MERKNLVLVHTSSTLEPVFERLCRDRNLNVNLVHVADPSLISDVIAQGELTASTSQRVLDHLTAAEETSADYIMVTCSSLGPAVEEAQEHMRKPILRVDQPLADQAIKLGTRIGVVATLVTTMAPTTKLIERRAREAEKEIEIITELCEGAFKAYADGNFEEHDSMVLQAVKKLAKEVDVVVLAQASMARIVRELNDGEVQVPILSSPSLAVDYLASLL
jgi:Asp/Glu/hydantoin racemase